MKLFRVIVPVKDIEQAARFYGAVLGMEGRRISAGRHYFDCEGTIVACFDPNADGDGWEAAPNPDHLYFAADDLERAFEAAKKAGARLSDEDIHGEPGGKIAVRPWGERSFYIQDPFGNKLCFVDRQTVFTG